jgi:sulfotransferase family protein
MTAPSHTGAAWPNLFVVGAARAGTTSLWRYLDRHPEIWMAPIKEPNFFSGVRRPLNPDVHDEANYLRLFAPGAGSKLRGEASPSYLWSEGVPDMIKRVSPEARILVSLRDPVERTYSGYWYCVLLGMEDRAFPEAIREELDEPRNRFVVSSFYAEAVGRYLQAFPGAVHVLFLEELARDPLGEMRRVFDFLGVDAAVANRLDLEAHNSHALPRSRLAGLVHNSPRVRAAARAVAPLGLRLRVQQLLLKRAPRSAIESGMETYLTELFAMDVERLRTLLGRDVPWPRFGRTEDTGRAAGVNRDSRANGGE